MKYRVFKTTMFGTELKFEVDSYAKAIELASRLVRVSKEAGRTDDFCVIIDMNDVILDKVH